MRLFERFYPKGVLLFHFFQKFFKKRTHLFKYFFRGNEINFMSNLIPIAQSKGLKVRILTSLDPVYLTSRFIHTHFEMKINICFMITGQIQVLNMITFMILELMVISQILGEKSHIFYIQANDHDLE